MKDRAYEALGQIMEYQLRRTLKRHCSGIVQLAGVVAMGSKRCVLSSAFEAELVDYTKEMSKKMYGLTTIARNGHTPHALQATHITRVTIVIQIQIRSNMDKTLP